MMRVLTPVPDVMRIEPLAEVTDVDSGTAVALAVYLQDALALTTGNGHAIEELRETATETARFL